MAENFKQKTVLITGGSRGLGYETAKKFLQGGASVVITARSEKQLEEASKNLEKIGPVLAVPGDVSREQDVIRTVKEAYSRFGLIHVLVNNAGNSLVKKLIDTELDEWNRVFEVHSTGAFLMCREVLKNMKENRTRGKIVNVSSVAGKTGTVLGTAYSAAKAALIGLTKSLAKELAPVGINVNCVCPGAMDTKMFHEGSIGGVSRLFGADPEALLKSTISTIPLKRLLDPAEVADLIVYLASSRADGITGQAFTISCGLEMG